MYRQINVHTEDTKYQRILWRENQDHPFKVYELITITYGTACAPFLATRCIKELTIQEANQFPEATEVIARDTYMDDILTGAHTLEEALNLRNGIIQVLQKGGFELSKWSSNCSSLLLGIPQTSDSPKIINFSNEKVKTLGILWEPTRDMFEYNVILNS